MISERLRLILSGVFGVPPNSFSDDSSVDSIEKWDSLSHIDLILSLEAEYAVSFSPEEAMDMQSVRIIRLTLAEHGIDA